MFPPIPPRSRARRTVHAALALTAAVVGLLGCSSSSEEAPVETSRSRVNTMLCGYTAKQCAVDLAASGIRDEEYVNWSLSESLGGASNYRAPRAGMVFTSDRVITSTAGLSTFTVRQPAFDDPWFGGGRGCAFVEGCDLRFDLTTGDSLLQRIAPKATFNVTAFRPKSGGTPEDVLRVKDDPNNAVCLRRSRAQWGFSAGRLSGSGEEVLGYALRCYATDVSLLAYGGVLAGSLAAGGLLLLVPVPTAAAVGTGAVEIAPAAERAAENVLNRGAALETLRNVTDEVIVTIPRMTDQVSFTQVGLREALGNAAEATQIRYLVQNLGARLSWLVTSHMEADRRVAIGWIKTMLTLHEQVAAYIQSNGGRATPEVAQLLTSIATELDKANEYVPVLRQIGIGH